MCVHSLANASGLITAKTVNKLSGNIIIELQLLATSIVQLQADNLGLLFRLADASLAIANACIRLYSCVVLAIHCYDRVLSQTEWTHYMHMIASHDGISSFCKSNNEYSFAMACGQHQLRIVYS